MKKLQEDFTNPEQSMRLLELGLPAWTANCYMINNQIEHGWKYNDYEIHVGNCEYQQNDTVLPCWTFGRLIEIYLRCCTTLNQNDAYAKISIFGIDTGNLIDDMYDMIAERALIGRMNFLKLDEYIK